MKVPRQSKCRLHNVLQPKAHEHTKSDGKSLVQSTPLYGKQNVLIIIIMIMMMIMTMITIRTIIINNNTNAYAFWLMMS